VLYSTIALGTTLFARYAGELSYIYLVNWESLRQKTPVILLNLIFDLILLLVILLYAKKLLRNKRKLPWMSSKEIYQEETLKGQQASSSEYQKLINPTLPNKVKDTNILNELAREESSYYKSLNHTDNPNDKVGIGQGLGRGVALHYPTNMTFDPARQKRPLPALPKDELDDVSLPPPVPLASPDYDDL